jgi:hypothetical protein
MNNRRPERFMISLSLLSQALGFSLLGSFMAIHPNADCGCKIGALLALLAGTAFLSATIKYWRYSRRFSPKRTLNVHSRSAVTNDYHPSRILAAVAAY